MEQFIIGKEQRRANRAEPQGSQLVVVVEYDSAEEEAGDIEGTLKGEIMVAKLLKGKTYTYTAFILAKGKEKVKIKEKEAYLFDISKVDQIFDFLAKDK